MDLRNHLLDEDWSSDWQELQKSRKHADNSKYWDERSKTYRSAKEHSLYSNAFMNYLDIEAGEWLLDMGCGNGAIAIPAALKGAHVIAADFSEGMLESLKEQVGRIEDEQHRSLDITTKLLSWEGDWASAGITKDCVDVAIASRSIATSDLRASLLKLTDAARRRCAITLPVGSSPRADLRILKELGIECKGSADFVYAFMILLQEGYLPSVQYIISERDDTFESREEAVDAIRKMVEHSTSALCGTVNIADLDERIDKWVSNNLVSCSAKKASYSDTMHDNCYCFKRPRQTYWAYLSWDTVVRDEL